MGQQTKVLFTPPHLIYTLLWSAISVGVVGTYNTVMLWLPEMVNQMTAYSADHPEYGVTVCRALASRSLDGGGQTTTLWTYNATEDDFSNRLAYTIHGQTDGDACVAQVDKIAFLSNIAVGVLQIVAFLATNPVVGLFGRKIVLGCLLALPSLCCFIFANWADVMYLSIAMLATLVVLISATVPIMLNIIVDLFPTNIRTMATSIAMISGRIGAAMGGQIFGLYLQTHCAAAFNTIGVVLLFVTGATIVMPIKRSSV